MLSYHNEAGAGVNSLETQLTPANITADQFGKRFATLVDGQVYAQPLYVADVNITAGSSPGHHRVVYVATEHDSVYVIDADSGAVLWQNLLLLNRRRASLRYQQAKSSPEVLRSRSESHRRR